MPTCVIDNNLLTNNSNPKKKKKTLVGVLGFGPSATFLYIKFVYCQ
jgi:hypothetical protein